MPSSQVIAGNLLGALRHVALLPAICTPWSFGNSNFLLSCCRVLQFHRSTTTMTTTTAATTPAAATSIIAVVIRIITILKAAAGRRRDYTPTQRLLLVSCGFFFFLLIVCSIGASLLSMVIEFHNLYWTPDITDHGQDSEILDFNDWLGRAAPPSWGVSCCSL